MTDELNSRNQPSLTKGERTMKPIFGAIMLFCLLTETSFGLDIGYYTIIKGTSSEMCVAYVRNLNSLIEEWSYMSCDRRINPKFRDFSKPPWQRIDKWEYIKLVKQIIRLFDNFNSRNATENKLEWWLRSARTLYSIRVDIDNDESIERVIRYEFLFCGGSRRYASPIMVVDDQMKYLDVEATRHLLQNPFGDHKNFAGNWLYAMYDVFLYKGKVYFDKWSDDFNQKGYIHVFKTEQGITQEVCTLKFELYPGVNAEVFDY